jgi:hypothetical protein
MRLITRSHWARPDGQPAARYSGRAYEGKKILSGLPRIIRPKENPPELDYSPFYENTRVGRPLLSIIAAFETLLLAESLLI